MAEIKFYANNVTSTASSGDAHQVTINHGAGSGIGFYGGGYGVSVPVASYQDTTFTTNADGTAADYMQLHNTKFLTSTGVNADGNTIALQNLPNYLAPLNVRFTHSSAVKVQSCKLRIFDRKSINAHASGVETRVFEVRHPSSLQSVANLAHRGRTDNTWLEYDAAENLPGATPTDMTFTSSPGMSGLNAGSTDTDTALGYSTTQGALHEAQRHDWYVALSCTPQEIGSKTDYGLYFTVEYV